MRRNWYWTKWNGLAVLYEDGREPCRYNSKSVRDALETVKSRRNEYVTDAAWDLQVQKFSEGVACLDS